MNLVLNVERSSAVIGSQYILYTFLDPGYIHVESFIREGEEY